MEENEGSMVEVGVEIAEMGSTVREEARDVAAGKEARKRVSIRSVLDENEGKEGLTARNDVGREGRRSRRGSRARVEEDGALCRVDGGSSSGTLLKGEYTEEVEKKNHLEVRVLWLEVEEGRKIERRGLVGKERNLELTREDRARKWRNRSDGSLYS